MAKRDSLLKYLAGGICAAAFLAVVVWLIQREGERTREAMREATAEVGKEVREGLVEGAEQMVDKAAEAPGKIMHDFKEEVQDSTGMTVEDAVGEMRKLSGDTLQEMKDLLNKSRDQEDGSAPGQAPAVQATGQSPSVAATTAGSASPNTLPTMPTQTSIAPRPPSTFGQQGTPSPLTPSVSSNMQRPSPEVQTPPPPTQVPQQASTGIPPQPGQMPTGYPGGMTPGRTAPSMGQPTNTSSEPSYHHASTAYESQMRGMADLVRSRGQANLANSAAAINYSVARQNEIQNRMHWTNTYFEMRRANRAYRAAERRPKPTMEELVRLAQVGKPDRLSPSELDSVSGKIKWPLLLQGDGFAEHRAQVEAAFAKRANQQAIDLDEYMNIQRTIGDMRNELLGKVRESSPGLYIASKRFLDSLAYEAGLAEI